MKKKNFVELSLNKHLIVRETSVKRMHYKLKQLHVTHLFDHPKSSVRHVITNMDMVVGNIFEATL